MALLFILTLNKLAIILMIAMAVITCILFFCFKEIARLSEEIDDIRRRLLDAELDIGNADQDIRILKANNKHFLHGK